MTAEQLREIKKVIGDMRFMQATALVSSGMQESKQARAYMSHLAKLDRLVENEITEALK